MNGEYATGENNRFSVIGKMNQDYLSSYLYLTFSRPCIPAPYDYISETYPEREKNVRFLRLHFCRADALVQQQAKIILGELKSIHPFTNKAIENIFFSIFHFLFDEIYQLFSL